MSKFIAITNKPGLTEEEFRQALDRTGKWRYGRRAWVVKAYCALETGKLIIESEAPDQGTFEEWLSSKGWEADEIHRLSFVHEEGLVWNMRTDQG